jgi:hypothetical protein
MTLVGQELHVDARGFLHMENLLRGGASEHGYTGTG